MTEEFFKVVLHLGYSQMTHANKRIKQFDRTSIQGKMENWPKEKICNNRMLSKTNMQKYRQKKKKGVKLYRRLTIKDEQEFRETKD